MENNNDLVVMITTVSSKDDAIELGKSLVENQLVACVQLDTISSIYSWNDEMQIDDEIRLMIKLLPEHLEDTISHIKANHPYDTPEIISTNFNSEQKYLDWCREVSK